MSSKLVLDMIGKENTNGDEYFFTRPNMPVLVDLSQCVIFVHPHENGDGTYGAELVIKRYYLKSREEKQQKPRSNGRKQR